MRTRSELPPIGRPLLLLGECDRYNPAGPHYICPYRQTGKYKVATTFHACNYRARKDENDVVVLCWFREGTLMGRESPLCKVEDHFKNRDK